MSELFTVQLAEDAARKNQAHEIAEATRILREGLTGGIHAMHRLEEAISTSDFHTRLVQGFQLAGIELVKKSEREWEPLAVRTTVPDFRSVQIKDFFGGLTLEEIPEGAEYPLGGFQDTNLELKAKKYGAGYKFTWEMWRNRDFSGLLNIPQTFANAAIDAENRAVFGLFLNGQGKPNATLFDSKDGQGTKPLGYAALEEAYTALTLRKRIDGKSAVDLHELYLVVHPANLINAERLLNADKIKRTLDGGEEVTEQNPLRGRVKVLASQTLADLGADPKAWYLVPGKTSKNPALGMAFLQGREAPEFRAQNNQGTLLGGGQLLFEDGSFRNDTIEYRVQHVLGAATLFNQATFASTGAK